MAILDSIPGLDVSVCVDGAPLQEYDDDEELVSEKPGAIGEYQKARTVLKYVEAVSNAEFTVHITLGTSFNMDCPTLSNPISVDGKFAIEPCVRKQSYASSIHGNRVMTPVVRIVDGVHVAAPGKKDQQFIKPFKFSHIDTSMCIYRPF